MYLRQLLRKPISNPSRFTRSFRRLESTKNQLPQDGQATAKNAARMERVLNRTPRFLRRYVEGLRGAPASHVIAFLILHEITAIVPLFGLAGLFHYMDWLPSMSSDGYMSKYVDTFERYFQRKGWFVPDSTAATQDDQDVVGVPAIDANRAEGRRFNETGRRVVIEFATAYAITKAVLPLRLMFSVWATPWFARIWIGGTFRRLTAWGRRLTKTKTTSNVGPAAKTGALNKGAVEGKPK